VHKTILLLASDAAIRNVIRATLESRQYLVLCANHLGDAADLLQRCTPDLLIVRPYTEGISGHEAAVYLRRKCAGIPVLILGGFLNDADFEGRAAIERFDLFPRPFTAAELLDKVREVMIDRSQAGA
jgi:DNA-binding response OmpR family regulator